MRRGIALIELIFSIVIIALVLTAVPNLISASSKSGKQAISQEAISNAASHASMVMSQYWDEADTDNAIGNVVLDTNTTFNTFKTVEYNASLGLYPFHPKIILLNTNYKLLIRKGSPIKTNRRYYSMDSNGTYRAASAIGADEALSDPDDIDDYNGRSYTLITHGAGQTTNATEGEYKDTALNISTKVEYVDDTYNNADPTKPSYYPSTVSAATSNVKLITVTVTSTNDPNKKIILKSFSSNIGSSAMKERLF